MGDNGRIISVRLTTKTAEDLERVVSIERRQARPGHKVTRNGLVETAVEVFVAHRLRRGARAATPSST